jgi:hypothetical protein
MPWFNRVKTKKIVLNIERKGWGKGMHLLRKYVLYSASNKLLDFFPKIELHTVIIKYADSTQAPVVGYQRGKKGEFQVCLSAHDNCWNWYTYQFAHELCHILCKYYKVDLSQNPRNQWFEETLCETASLFVLRQMTLDWQNSPDKYFRSCAPIFKDYAQSVLDETDINLPPNTSLSKWYQRNEQLLRQNYLLRDKERIVANILLPLFEESPEHWQAIAYLNEAPFEPAKPFTRYLSDWHQFVPEKHKPFVKKIASLFEIAIA